MIHLLKIGLDSRYAKKLLAITILGLSLHILGLYFLNDIYGELYAALQVADATVIWASLRNFAAIAGLLVLVDGYTGYFINKLAFAIRQTLTTHHLSKHPGKFNQQIQEDLRQFSDIFCDLFSALFKAAIKLPIFAYIVASLTTWWVATILVVCAIAGTVLTKWLSKTQIKLQATQEANEAEFRLKLTAVSFTAIQDQFLKINKEIKKLSFLQSGLMQTFVLLPFVLLLPLYISKAITFGAFMQSVNALNKVIDSLTILIDNRQLIVRLDTSIQRLKVLK